MQQHHIRTLLHSLEDHIAAVRRDIELKEVLAWLDRYLRQMK
jgi:hypothetical protein